MQFPEISPYVLGLHWGSFGIRWYALAYIAGILLGWRYLVHLVRKERLWGGRAPSLTALQIDDLVLWVTAGVILGGRVGYVLFYMLPNEAQRAGLAENPLEVFAIWNGGMSFHGGLLGVLLAMFLFAKAAKADLLRVGDLVCAAVPIGMFFGRIANFINGELWGRITDVPWAIRFCNEAISVVHGGACPAGDYLRHPSQLYEALLEGLLLFVILAVVIHKRLWLRRRGMVAGLFLIGMAVFRTFVEQFRQPDSGFDALPLGLTMGMMLSAPMILLGLWLLWRGMKEPLAAPAVVDAPAKPPEAKTSAPPPPPKPQPAPKAPAPATKPKAAAKPPAPKAAAKPKARAKPAAKSPAKPKPKPKA